MTAHWCKIWSKSAILCKLPISPDFSRFLPITVRTAISAGYFANSAALAPPNFRVRLYPTQAPGTFTIESSDCVNTAIQMVPAVMVVQQSGRWCSSPRVAACQVAPKACSWGARRQEKGNKATSIDGGGERSHRSLSPSANRPAQLAGPTHPPQARRPHPHCPPSRRDVPRAVAAPSPALLVSKLAAVDSVTTWVLRLSRDGHIGFLLGLCEHAPRARAQVGCAASVPTRTEAGYVA